MKQLAWLVALLASAAVVFVLIPTGAGQTVEEELWRHRNIGKALFETPTSIAEAPAELKKALELAPDSFRDRLNYGLALLRAGDTKNAIAELEKAQKQNPTLPHTWFNLGIAYKRQGRHADAIRQFERMARLVPDEPVTHYNLGLLYNLTERPSEALKQFERAASLDPGLVAPRYQIYTQYRLQGKEKEAARALAVFQEVKAAQMAADDSEDMEWSFYAELYDPIQARPSASDTSQPAELKFRDERLEGTIGPESAGLLLLDAFGEGKADLLAWSRLGIRLYRGGKQAVAESGLEGLKSVIAVAAGDFDNDGLPDLCVLTQAGPELYRNAKGRFEKKEAKLPAGPFEAALWFDFDHDYDLDLLLFGKKSLLLRNENGTFQDYTGRFPFAPGHAIAVVPFRVVPDAEALDLAVAYRDHSGVLYRDGLRGVFQARRFAALPAGAASLRAVDIDNDGWIDVAYASSKGVSAALNRRGRFEAIPTPALAAGSIAFADLESRGFPDLVSTDAVFRNQGLGKFASGKTPPGFAAAVAWAEADFDGDGRADLAAVAKDGSLHLLTNQTVTKNQSLRVALNGVKNLRTAVGAVVEVKAGDHYQKRIYAGTPLLFGLGPRAEIDTVRISWPNGLLQNQPGQKAGAALITEAPRLAGSCPMVFAWDGHGFRFVSDVLGVAPLGASSGDGQYFPVDTDEYLELAPGALAAREGRYEIRITEELHEVSYIDQVRLIAVDHPEETEIFTNDKFKSPPFPEFRLFGVKRRIYPFAARDGNGKDVLAALNDRDGVYVKGFHHDAAGKAEMHTLELDFPAGVARDNRAVLILNGWIDWADGSTFMAASQGGAGLIMPYLQVKDATGNWRTVVEDMGAPSGGPKTIAVDLTDKFLSASRGIRIVTNVCLYWDQIFLSEQVQTPPSHMTAVDAATADLRLRGFSKAMVDPQRERPEWYDYAHWEPSAMWNPVRGRYTRYGDVRELTGAVDDRFVIMGSGDELQLTFDARQLPAIPRGWKRDWLFLVDGWSKDADANTAFADSVEPLPFHGMSQYPYPASERFPDDALHRAWRERYNTRREMRLMERLAWTAKPGPN